MLGAMSVSIAESAFLGAETKELVLGFVFCTLFPHKHLVSFYHILFWGTGNHMVNKDGEESKF